MTAKQKTEPQPPRPPAVHMAVTLRIPAERLPQQPLAHGVVTYVTRAGLAGVMVYPDQITPTGLLLELPHVTRCTAASGWWCATEDHDRGAYKPPGPDTVAAAQRLFAGAVS